MSRRIWLALAFFGLVAVLSWHVWVGSDPFARIRLGMTDKEVLEILGPPGNRDDFSTGAWEGKSLADDDSKRFLKMWRIQGRTMTVWFNNNRTVTSIEIDAK